jgi:hypothetical protein
MTHGAGEATLAFQVRVGGASSRTVCYVTRMTKTLERAMAEAAALPEAAQDKIGRDLLTYLAKLRSLRETIDASIAAGGNHTDEEVEAYTERLHADSEREGR